MIDESQINPNLDKLHQHFDSVLEITEKAGPCPVEIRSIGTAGIYIDGDTTLLDWSYC